MNTELMLEIAEVIEIHEEKFNMSSYFSGDDNDQITEELQSIDCNSTACIAGWAVALVDADQWITNTTGNSVCWLETGAKVLGLTDEQAMSLFFVDMHTIWEELSDEYDDIDLSNQQVGAWTAADVLRRIAKGDIVL